MYFWTRLEHQVSVSQMLRTQSRKLNMQESPAVGCCIDELTEVQIDPARPLWVKRFEGVNCAPQEQRHGCSHSSSLSQ